MRSFSICGVVALLLLTSTLRAQTLNPPGLLCASTAVSGDVTLNWTIPSNPCGMFTAYYIYASTSPTGPFTLLDSVLTESVTSYIHLGANGNSITWYYYLVPAYDCPGFGVVNSDTLDNLNPEPPDLDVVTVLSGGLVRLDWFVSSSPEVYAYIIYRQTSGFSPIDTVYGKNTTTYTDVTATPDSQIETYTVAAMDSCDNLGIFNPLAHNTIYLVGGLDRCKRSINMGWNLYQNWPDGIAEQQIIYSVNGGASVQDAVLPGDTTAYVLQNLNDGDSVCVWVRAVRSDGNFSESNQLCFNVNVVAQATYSSLRNATMLTNNKTQVDWYLDPAADLEGYLIERSNNGMSGWVTTAAGALSAFPMSVIDSFSSAGKYYRALSVDSCGDQFASQYARTVLIKGEPGFDLVNRLEWNAFEMTGATVQAYHIYRFDGSAFVLLSSTAASKLTYDDDISAQQNSDGEFCYYVEAEFDLSLLEPPLNETLRSRSNELCIQQRAKIYVPNAIVPNGTNNVFKPVLLFDQAGTYNMQIFNRYGAVIFESAAPDYGWDGTYQGQLVSGGAYAYLISFRSTGGRDIIKKGTVLVVR